eukprot:jgi/Bigna1/129977/aug1.10_g4685
MSETNQRIRSLLITVGATASVVLSVWSFFYYYLKIQSIDQFINWALDWPFWLLDRMSYAVRTLITKTLDKFKDVGTDFVKKVGQGFKGKL